MQYPSHFLYFTNMQRSVPNKQKPNVGNLGAHPCGELMNEVKRNEYFGLNQTGKHFSRTKQIET